MCVEVVSELCGRRNGLVDVEGEILAPTFFGRTCVRRSAVRGDLHEHQRIALSCAVAHRSFVRSLSIALFFFRQVKPVEAH